MNYLDNLNIERVLHDFCHFIYQNKKFKYAKYWCIVSELKSSIKTIYLIFIKMKF